MSYVLLFKTLRALLRMLDYTTIYAQKKLLYRTLTSLWLWYMYIPLTIGRAIGTYEID